MAAGATRSSASGKKRGPSSDEPLLTIGQLVGALQTEFPGLTITKVRYLEDRGLLAPVRSKGRYRKYTKADVRALRTILTLQRDEYLPLEVIRTRVSHSAAPGSQRTGVVTGLSGHRRLSLRDEEPLYGLEELCSQAGVGEAFVRGLEEYRLLERADSTGPSYTDGDVEIVRICHQLARFQVEPRNLRLLSSSSEREAALVEQVSAGLLRSTHPDKKEFGVKMVEDLGMLFSQLNHLLLCRELRRLL